MKRRNTVRKEERVGGTPETLAKLEQDWRVRLSPDEQIAAERISEAYAMVTAGSGLSIQNWFRHDRAANDYETDRERILQNHYNDWVDACVVYRHPKERFKINTYRILDVICDPLSRDIKHNAVTWVWPSGTGGGVPMGHIEIALGIYTKISGGR